MKYVLYIILAVIVLGFGITSTANATATLPASPQYVALGDSVAAGAGLPLLAGASAEDSLCGRSSAAYSQQVASSLGTDVTLLACSGAKVDEGIYGPQTRKGSVLTAQLDQAFSTGKPDVITVTIGANDARWIEFMTKCYITTCGTRFDDAAAKVLRADLRVELAAMLYKLKSLSGTDTPPKVLISGYYTPLASTECLGANRITPTELSWIKTQTANLNQAIRSVTPYASYATYVPVDFTGHELCSADPWVQAITATAPLHPTVDGQAAMAQAFTNSIASMTPTTTKTSQYMHYQRMGTW